MRNPRFLNMKIRVKTFISGFKKRFTTRLGRKIAYSLLSKKITEEHILDDFKEFKKSHHPKIIA